MHTVTVNIDTYGKDKEFGYKVCVDGAYLLAGAGWTITKRTSHYRFVTPPTGVTGGRVIALVLDVPSDEEIFRLAENYAGSTTPEIGTIGKWPYRYIPSHSVRIGYTDIDFETGKHLATTTTDRPEHATLYVGLMTMWAVHVGWNADGKSFIRYRSTHVEQTQPNLFGQPIETPKPAFEPGYIAFEGTEVLALHLKRERDKAIVDRKKQLALEATGALACEACGFDFFRAYGEAGKGLIDCHHRKPISTLMEGEPTHLEDLALVCCNCHRVIHRTTPPIAVEELKRVLSTK